MAIKRKKELVLVAGLLCNSTAWVLNEFVDGVPHIVSLSLAIFSLVLFGWVIWLNIKERRGA